MSPKVLLPLLQFGILRGRISGEGEPEVGHLDQQSPPLDELSLGLAGEL